MKEQNFHIERNNKNPDLFIIKASENQSYTVIISDDLFESHRCTCNLYKKEGSCIHITSVLEKITTKEEKIQENIMYLDVETRFSADDVGGWNNIEQMKVAIVVIYISKEDKFYHYTEEEIISLIDKLKEATLVVGFNIKRFDYRVIQPYISDFSLSSLPTFDILEEIYKTLGHRISLNELAKATLGVQKSADGLQSIEWFKRGEIEKIIEYCKQDVILTRDLFLFLKKCGYLKFYDKKNDKIRTVTLNHLL